MLGSLLFLGFAVVSTSFSVLGFGVSLGELGVWVLVFQCLYLMHKLSNITYFLTEIIEILEEEDDYDEQMSHPPYEIPEQD
jgi:hypothetical protein